MTIKKINLIERPDGSKGTLLDSFIYQKLKSYVPPEGKRTGFSWQKYFASLLLLKTGGYNLKAVAKTAKVSYGLLRKWTTEKEWGKLVNEQHHEFVQLFLKHIEFKTEKQLKIFDEFIKKPIEEIAEKECPQLGIDEYKDIAQYNDILLSRIIKVLGEITEKIGKLSKRSLSNNIKLCNYFVKKKPLSKGETVEGLMKEKVEIMDNKVKIFPLMNEVEKVFGILSAVYDLPHNKRKYAVFNTMRDPKLPPGKVVKLSSPIDNKSWLELAKLALTHDSFTLKKKDGKIVMKQKPVKEINRKLAVYYISQAIRNTE